MFAEVDEDYDMELCDETEIETIGQNMYTSNLRTTDSHNADQQFLNIR